MKRRSFIQGSLLSGAAIPSMAMDFKDSESSMEGENSIIEIRKYHMAFRGSQQVLLDYLTAALSPSLTALGAPPPFIMKEYGGSDPAQIWVGLSFQNMATYLEYLKLSTNDKYLKLSSSYDSVPSDRKIYDRYESFLLYGFDGFPSWKTPSEESNLFELRIYEGYSEDAVRRKIMMFNDEEIELFLKLGLNPVFFGDMVSGPYRPSLVYMLEFPDMEVRNQRWQTFIAHPEWKEMASKEIYANTVSKIHKIFLLPA